MKLITKEIEKRMEKFPYGSQDGKKAEEIEIIAKFFNPTGVGTWIATEVEEKTEDDIIFYGVAELGYGYEWGSFSLKELENLKLPYGLSVERDMYCGNKLTDVLFQSDLKELGLLKDSYQEIVTPLNEIDEEHSYTVARVVEDDKCVELHYTKGQATVEFLTKNSLGDWEGTSVPIIWFDKNMSEKYILSKLNEYYEDNFLNKNQTLDGSEPYSFDKEYELNKLHSEEDSYEY